MRFCVIEGCYKRLPGQNKSGYCLEHRYLNPVVKAESIERLNQWQEDNPERVKEYREEWVSNNPDKVATTQQRYRDANPTAGAEAAARWRENHRDRYLKLSAEYSSNRRALLKNQFVEYIDRNIVFERDGGVCYLCDLSVGEDWHLDHVIPLSKGGLHSYDNVAVTHPLCNMRKKRQTFGGDYL